MVKIYYIDCLLVIGFVVICFSGFMRLWYFVFFFIYVFKDGFDYIVFILVEREVEIEYVGGKNGGLFYG